MFLSGLSEPFLMVLVPRAMGKAEAANIIKAQGECLCCFIYSIFY